MPIQTSTVSPKFQATIPRHTRRTLKVKPGEMVRWHVQKSVVVVSAAKKMKDPLAVLLNQVKKPIEVDAVALIRQVRDEL